MSRHLLGRRARKTTKAGKAVRLLAIGVGALAFDRVLDLALEKLSEVPDPTFGLPFGLPPGDEVHLTMRDGASICVKSCPPEVESSVPIFMVHGWGTDMRSWGTIARELTSMGHRVIMMDVRSHGKSTTGAEGITVEAIARDLSEVLEKLDINGCLLAGHSMGATIIQRWLVENCSAIGPTPHGKRALAVALISSGATDKRQDPRLVAFATSLARSRSLERILSMPRLGLVILGIMADYPANLIHIRALRDHHKESDPITDRDTVQFTLEDYSDGLSGISMPVAVVVGERDRFVPVKNAKRLAGFMPGSRLVTIPGVGHVIALGAPRQAADILHDLAVPQDLKS